jgi:cytochrome o ubiquinol oxidase subunit 2
MRKEKKHNFRRLTQVLFSSFIAIAVIGILVFVTYGRAIPVLETKGLIANQERDLILLTFGLGMVIVIPVLITLFSVAWRYRASNTKLKYQPDFSGHRGIEALWWGVPCVVILILAVITGVSTHALDPYQPISSSIQPVKIQVISLNWRWLFLYPDQAIATVNYVNIPKDTPINFTITSDAPMNSFWVPALAGQVYAMSGMSTQLHVMADSTGTFTGSSANMSGDGFADMHFKVNSMNESDFNLWVKKTTLTSATNLLTDQSYKTLAADSHDRAEKSYMLMDHNLYNEIIMKYMSPSETKLKSVDATGANL